VAKIPNWAAAPKRIRRGFAINAEKSVNAPTPRKISEGYIPLPTPNRGRKVPSLHFPRHTLCGYSGDVAYDHAKTDRHQEQGSNSLLIPRYTKRMPAAIMTMLPNSTFRNR
jgi:hypothetical protein